MIAINGACKTLSRNLTREMKYIKIFSDSQAAVLALANQKITSKIVAQTVLSLNTLANKVHRVELEWIKAHEGNPGNERADKLARAAVNEPLVTDLITPSWAAFKMLLKEKIYTKWKEKWLLDPAYRMTKIFYPEPNSIKAK